MSTVSPGLLRAPRSVIFGPGQRKVLGRQVATIGKTALVCTDRRLAGSPELAAMIEDLSDHGVSVAVWSETEAELPSENIATCYEAMADRGIDVVIGVGGGSCLDMAKAVALLLAHGGPLERYYGEYAVPGPVVPIVAVPTTAGTGSEATPVCVLTDARRELKTGISSPELIPTIAICDPELTVSCPTALTASAGADALSHLVESFTAIRRPASVLGEQRVFIGKNVISDHYARWGLELIATALPRAVEEPDDLAARADTMLAANAGGFALGVAGTAAAHALQYPIGAITHTPHGIGVGVLLPYVMRFNASARTPEFAEIGRLLGQTGGTERELALKGIEAVDAILTKIGIPKTLADIGLTEDRLQYVAEQGLVSKRLAENNPRPLDVDAMMQIVTAAYRGDLTMPF